MTAASQTPRDFTTAVNTITPSHKEFATAVESNSHIVANMKKEIDTHTRNMGTTNQTLASHLEELKKEKATVAASYEAKIEESTKEVGVIAEGQKEVKTSLEGL